MCGRLTRNGEETFYQDIAGYNKWANAAGAGPAQPVQPGAAGGDQRSPAPGEARYFLLLLLNSSDNRTTVGSANNNKLNVQDLG